MGIVNTAGGQPRDNSANAAQAIDTTVCARLRSTWYTTSEARASDDDNKKPKQQQQQQKKYKAEGSVPNTQWYVRTS